MNIHSFPVGSIIQSNSGYITEANSEAEKIFRISADELAGKKLFDLPCTFFNEDGNFMNDEDFPSNIAFKSGKAVSGIVSRVCNCDKRKTWWYRVFSVPEISDGETTPNHVITSFFDITDEKWMSEKYQNLITNSNLGTWEWNVLTGEVVFNNRWAEIAGYSLEELQPVSIQTWKDLAHPEDLIISEELLKRHFNGELENYECQLRIKHKNGEWIDILDSGKVLTYTEDGRPEIMTGIHQDISHLKFIERDLSRKLQLEEIISDISSKFLVTKNFDKTLVEAFALLGSFNDSSRIYFFQIEEEGTIMNNTHEWCNIGVTPEIDNLQNLPVSIFPWWMSRLMNRESIEVPDVSLLPPEASQEKEVLQSQNIKSVLVLPVFVHDKLVGFVGFDDVYDNNSWSALDQTMIKMLSDIIANALERSMDQKRLEESFKNLEDFFNLHIDMVCILDEDANIISINQTFMNALDYNQTEIVGMPVYAIFKEEDKECIEKTIETIVEVNKAELQLHIYKRDMDVIPVMTTFSKGKWAGKDVYYAVSKDVSDIKKAEKQVNLLSKAIDEIPVGIFISNLDGKILYTNNALSKITGFSREEIFAQGLTEDMNIDYDSELKQIANQNQVISREILKKRKDGKDYWAFELMSPIFENGILSHYVFVRQDITERVNLMNELITTKEKAVESDKLKSAFLATMNHELRTPLNHIIGFSSMIPDMTSDRSIVEFSEMINRSGTELQVIIEDVLDLALFEQSKVKIRLEEYYARDIYLNIKKLLQDTLSDSDKRDDILLKYSFDSSLATKKIVTDKIKIMQVMSNIIRNAVKFTDKGFIELKFCIKNNYLNISISDTGIGIPKDKQSILFEFFRQVDDSNTRIHGGIGVGLAISQKIAKLMGGDIIVESDYGNGSTFSFRIPVKFDDSPIFDNRLVQNTELLEDFEPEATNIKQILVVEDNYLSREMIKKMMSNTGYKCLSASNGKEALEMIEQGTQVDLILLDLNMPVMDGITACEAFRKRKIEIPIIALTAFTNSKEAAYKAGCNDFIHKPISKQTLLRRLKKYLN